jgi:hypothetical protein
MLAAWILKSELLADLNGHVSSRKVLFGFQKFTNIGDTFRPREGALDLVLDVHLDQCERIRRFCPAPIYGLYRASHKEHASVFKVGLPFPPNWRKCAAT